MKPTKVEEKLEEGKERDGKVEGVNILNEADAIFSARSDCRDSDPAVWVFLGHILALFQVIRRPQTLQVEMCQF